MSEQNIQKNFNYPIPYFTSYYPGYPTGVLPQYTFMPVSNMNNFSYYSVPNFQPVLPIPSFTTTTPAIPNQNINKSGSANVIRQPNPLNQQLSSKKQNKNSSSCHCSKSRCLKEYCLCFKNGSACSQTCNCTNCKNTEDELNQKRHPRTTKQVKCKCSKSQCIKKYCQCYSFNQKCDQSCTCTSCQNVIDNTVQINLENNI